MASCSVASLLPSSSTIGSAKRLSHGTTRLRNRTAIQADAGRFVPGVGLTEPVGPPGLSRAQILVALPAPQGRSSRRRVRLAGLLQPQLDLRRRYHTFRQI